MMKDGQIKAGKVSPTSKNPLEVMKSPSPAALLGGFDNIAQHFEFTVSAVFAGAFEIGAGNLIGVV